MNEPVNHNATKGLSGLPGRRSRISVEKSKHPKLVMLRLWQYVRRQKFLLLVTIVLLLINTSATLAGSYLLRPIINRYIIPHNIPGLVKMIFILLGIYVTGAAAAFGQNRVMILVAQKTVCLLRSDLFDKLQSLPVRYFDQNSRGELMSRFSNDVDNVSESLDTSVLQLLTSAITLAGTFVLMLCISPVLTLVTLAMVSLMLFVASAIIKKSKGFFIQQQAVLGAVNGYGEEMINGQKTLKVMCFEDSVTASFEKINSELREKATKAQLYSGVMMPVIQNLNTINFALTATAGGILAILRGLDIGGLAAFLQYSRQFGRPVNEISSQYNSVQSALAGAERIFQILDELPEPADAPGAIALAHTTGAVSFNHVTFGYDQDKPVLNNFSLSVSAGQKVAFVGSTGAGKTTIINLLPRFYDILSGQITIDGIDIRNIQRNSLRHNIAIVLQDTHLFTTTVMENIRYGRLEATDDEVVRAATLSGAHDFIQLMTNGYQSILQNDGSSLSQGQRQLLNIARAAVANPSILVLDEATSSIDTRTEQVIQKGMDLLMQGRTSFVIAHRLSTVRNADEIIVLEAGQIIERGNHVNLLALKGKYFRLYTRQFD